MKSQILENQRDWALKSGLQPDEKGYLPSYEDNLFQPMSESTKVAFDRGSGSELVDSPRSPAKMRALHSSSALAVNVFDYWAGVDNDLLLQALELDTAGPCSVLFEAQYPTGLPGNPPNLDVVLELPAGPVIAIESKFTEWLTPKPKSKAPFKEKYFPAGGGVWKAVSLPQCQLLAESMMKGSVTFRYLDAAQLLKHALGLASHLENFRLFYTYFDAACQEGDQHRNEIALFSEAVGAELGFSPMSYQKVFTRMQRIHAGSDEYRHYLQSRYF